MRMRKFKYLVGVHPATKEVMIGYISEDNFHADILARMPTGTRPDSAGYFSIEQEKHTWIVESIKIFGKSQGYDIYPKTDRDMSLLKEMMDKENKGFYTRFLRQSAKVF